MHKMNLPRPTVWRSVYRYRHGRPNRPFSQWRPDPGLTDGPLAANALYKNSGQGLFTENAAELGVDDTDTVWALWSEITTQTADRIYT